MYPFLDFFGITDDQMWVTCSSHEQRNTIWQGWMHERRLGMMF